MANSGSPSPTAINRTCRTIFPDEPKIVGRRCDFHFGERVGFLNFVHLISSEASRRCIARPAGRTACTTKRWRSPLTSEMRTSVKPRPEFPDQCQMRLAVLEQSRGAAIAEVDFLELRCVLRLLDARLADVGDQNVAASEILMQIFKYAMSAV